jgi:hypothetical protein
LQIHFYNNNCGRQKANIKHILGAQIHKQSKITGKSIYLMNHALKISSLSTQCPTRKHIKERKMKNPNLQTETTTEY